MFHAILMAENYEHTVWIQREYFHHLLWC